MQNSIQFLPARQMQLNIVDRFEYLQSFLNSSLYSAIVVFG